VTAEEGIARKESRMGRSNGQVSSSEPSSTSFNGTANPSKEVDVLEYADAMASSQGDSDSLKGGGDVTEGTLLEVSLRRPIPRRWRWDDIKNKEGREYGDAGAKG